MEPHMDLETEAKGFFVQDKEGKFYFLRNEEARHSAVADDDRAVLERLWAGNGSKPTPPGVPHPEWSCATLWNWLTHNPIDMQWRKVSVIWMNQC